MNNRVETEWAWLEKVPGCLGGYGNCEWRVSNFECESRTVDVGNRRWMSLDDGEFFLLVDCSRLMDLLRGRLWSVEKNLLVRGQFLGKGGAWERELGGRP